MTLTAHWDDRYENNPASKLSWYQESSPEVQFVQDSVGKGTPIIDIGRGAVALCAPTGEPGVHQPHRARYQRLCHGRRTTTDTGEPG